MKELSLPHDLRIRRTVSIVNPFFTQNLLITYFHILSSILGVDGLRDELERRLVNNEVAIPYLECDHARPCLRWLF